MQKEGILLSQPKRKEGWDEYPVFAKFAFGLVCALVLSSGGHGGARKVRMSPSSTSAAAESRGLMDNGFSHEELKQMGNEELTASGAPSDVISQWANYVDNNWTDFEQNHSGWTCPTTIYPEPPVSDEDE